MGTTCNNDEGDCCLDEDCTSIRKWRIVEFFGGIDDEYGVNVCRRILKGPDPFYGRIGTYYHNYLNRSDINLTNGVTFQF